MLEKFIEKSEICFNIGHPNGLGFLILIGLILLSLIGYLLSKK